MKYVKLTDNARRNMVVRMDGRVHEIYQDGEWIRSGIMIEYTDDLSPRYDMYEEITKEQADKLI